MSAYRFRFDAHIAAPRWERPARDGGRVVVRLVELEPDIRHAILMTSSGVARLGFRNRGDGSGELQLVPAAAPGGRHEVDITVRYSDDIQHIEQRVRGTVVVPAALRVWFTEHGTVRVDFPSPLAVTPALLDPRSYRIEPSSPGAAPVVIRWVGREERRASATAKLTERVTAPRYIELFVEPPAPGEYRLTLPALEQADGSPIGPASASFTARVVKRVAGARHLGNRLAPDHELAAGVVLSALFAEDDRAAGAVPEDGRG